MLVGAICIAIGAAAILAALAWFILRRKRSAHLYRTTALVTGSTGRPGDDLRAIVYRFTDADGTVRTETDDFHSNFAANRVGETIDIIVEPRGADGTPGRSRVPRQTDPTFLLNALLAASGVAFFIAGVFIFSQGALSPG